jgi:hypothetical protein
MKVGFGRLCAVAVVLTGERTVDSGGIATHGLVKDNGAWRIRHSHTAARRRAPGL